MTTLDDTVRSVIQDLMASGELFTALDVSNKVKMTLPFARHREVRDLVRGMFTTDMEVNGWARTPITVTLSDSTTAEALLYHPLSDSWDLDNKYDAQRRAQGAVKAAVVPATVSSTGVCTAKTPLPVVVAATVVAAPTVAQLQAKDRWAQLFDSQPSLFPLK